MDYFGEIARSGDDSLGRIQTPRVNGGLGHFSITRTADLLKKAKRTSSRVEGDPLVNLSNFFYEEFAVPVSEIYNRINLTGPWPKSWKTEHLTIIPKTPNPAGLFECRNISCTSVFSKVLEGQVLLKLRGKLDPDLTQYGGIPNCGVEPMLVIKWEEILEAMEGGKNAAVLLGVDYEKAFNRMDHSVCLRQLDELGASAGSLALVRAFLEDRVMTIDINDQRPTPVAINRGSPQGNILGCMLYCIA